MGPLKNHAVIIVTGEYSSGKSSFCRELQLSLPVATTILNVGAILESSLREFGRHEFALKSEIGKAFLKIHDVSVISALITVEAAKCIKVGRRIIIVDGIRFLKTYKELREQLNVVFHIHLTSEPTLTLYRQFTSRSRSNFAIHAKYKKLEQLYERDLKRIGKLANLTVKGSQSISEARRIANRIKRALGK